MSLYDDVNRSFGSYGTSDPFGAGSAMPGDAPVHESWMDVPVFSRPEAAPKFTGAEGETEGTWSEALTRPLQERPAEWKQIIGGAAQLPLIRSIPGVGEWGKALGEEGMREQEKLQPKFEDASPEYYGYAVGKTFWPMMEDIAAYSAIGAAAGAIGGGGVASWLTTPAGAAIGGTAGALKGLWRMRKAMALSNATKTGAQEYNKLKQQGYSDWAAIPLSAGYGGLEWLGDRFGIKALEKTNLSVLKRLVLSSASEIPGETGTTIGQAFLDKISTEPDMTMDDFLKQIRDTAVVAGVVGGGAGAISVPASRRFQAAEEKARLRAEVPEEAWTGMKQAMNNMIGDIGRVMPTIEQEYGPERAAALKRYLLFGIPMPTELEIAPTERLARQLRDEQLNQQFGFGVEAPGAEPNLPGLGPAKPEGEPALPAGKVPGAGQKASYVDLLSGPPAGTQAAVTEQLSQRDEAARIKDLEQKRQADLIGSGASTVLPGAGPGGPGLADSPLPGRQTIVPGAPTPPHTGSTSQQMFGVPSTAVQLAEQAAEGGEAGAGTGPTTEAYNRWKQQVIKSFVEALQTGQQPNIPPMPGGVATPQALGEAEAEARRIAGEATGPMPGMQTSPSPITGPLGPAPSSATAKAQTGLRLGQRTGILTPQVQPNPPGIPTVPSTKAAGAPTAPPGTTPPVPPAVPVLPGMEIPTAAAPAGTVGTSATITTPNQKTKVTVRYRVVEADGVVASNDPTTFAPNPAYPTALQPRERAREGYQVQIEGMVAALNPEMLMASPTTAQGAPVVGPDMVVESGNGRSMAIKRAYIAAPSQSASYKQALINSAASLGLDPNVVAGMKSPVLVRERTSEVPDRAAFTKEAGESDVSGTSAVEKARVDAQNMSQKLAELADIDEEGMFDPLSKGNAQFVAEWLQTIPVSERGALWQNGMLTREGIARIKNALFAKAYPASDKLLTLVAESADPEIKNVTNVMLGFAPAFARLRAMTEQGSRDANLMVADEIAKAAETYLDFKNQNALDLQGFLMQQGLLAETQYADVTKAIAAVFNEHGRSQAKLRTFINHMVRISNESGQGNLLGEMSPETKAESVMLAYMQTEGSRKNEALIRSILNVPIGQDTGVPQGQPGQPGESTGVQDVTREGAEAGPRPPVAGAETQPDIKTKSGEPFKNKSSATLAARKAGEGYVAVQVEGGWVARKQGGEDVALPAAGEPPVKEGTILEQRLAEIQKRLDAVEQISGESPFTAGDKVTYLGRPAEVVGPAAMGSVTIRTEKGDEIRALNKDVKKDEALPATGETPEGKIERTGNLQQGTIPGLSATETFELTNPEGAVGTPATETGAAPVQGNLFTDTETLPPAQQARRNDALQAELNLFGEQAQDDTPVEPPITTPVRERTASRFPKASDPALIGAQVKTELAEKGFTSFIGKAIKFISDLGFFGRMARSFRFEYNHFIATDPVTGQTLLENKICSYSNKTAASGSVQSFETFMAMAILANKGNPVRVFMMHNHPSGSPYPSNADIELTEDISNSVREFDERSEFGGHVIMNSNSYCVINDVNIQQYKDKVKPLETNRSREAAIRSIEGALRIVENESDNLRQRTGTPLDDILGKPGMMVTETSANFDETAQQLAVYGMLTQKDPSRGVIFFLDHHYKINGITDLPSGFFGRPYEEIADFFKRAGENLGSKDIAFWSPLDLTLQEKETVKRLMKDGLVREGSMGKEKPKSFLKTTPLTYSERMGFYKDLGQDMGPNSVRNRSVMKITTPAGSSPLGRVSPAGEVTLQDQQGPGYLPPTNDEVTQQVLEGQPALENPAVRDRVVGEVPLPERSATRYPYFGGGLLGRIIDTIRTYKHVDKSIQDRDVKALESLFMTPWALRKEHPEMKDALEIELQRHQDRKDLNAQLVGDPQNWNPEKPVEHPIFGLSDNEIKSLQKVAQTSTVDNVLYTDAQIKEMLAEQGVTNPEEVARITRGYRAMKNSYDNAIQKQIEARENMLFFPYQNEPWAADLERIMRMKAEDIGISRLDKNAKMNALEEALANYSKEEQARFRKAYATITEPWNLVKKYRQSMGQRVFYTPLEHGEGDYILRITKPDDEGKPQVVWSYRTRTALEASKIWEELKRDPEMKDLHGLPGTITKEAGTPESAYYRVYDDNLYRFMQIGMERLRASKTYDDEDIAVFTRKMSQALADELKARAFGQRMMTRRHADIGGYERKDIRASFLDYMAGTSGIITKQEAAAKFYELLRNVEKNKPGTYDYVSRYVDDMLRNRDDIDRFFDKGKHMATLYYIAGNLRLPLVQITQNMIMSVPMMAREISKIDSPKSPDGLMKNLYKFGKHSAEAHRRVIGAMKDVTTGKMTEDERVAVDTATRQGVTDAQFLKEIYGRMTNKWDRGAVKTFDYAMQPFQLLERMNRQAAFLSMYRMQKEALMKQGMSEAEAKAEAVKKGNEFVYDTQVLYGKANMPEAMRGKTVGSKLLGMAYTFKQYPHHFIQYLSQGVKEGHKATIERMGADADRLRFGPSMVYETPRFLYNYMTNALSAPGFEATILSMAWTVALGGAAAFPFLDDLLELYEKATGNPVRAKMSRVVRGGVPTMIGMDIGSSLKISAPWTMGTNFMEGLSESALGVYGGIAEKFGKSMEAAWSGNYYKAVEAGAPTMIEYPMKAYREYTEGAHTPRGKTIFDSDGKPLAPTFGEAALQAVGIKGARMKEEAQIYRSFDMIEERFNKWRDRIYTQYRKADSYEKQAELMSEITKFNMESQQKGMGGIAPITRESIKRALQEKPKKGWVRFGQSINAE